MTMRMSGFLAVWCFLLSPTVSAGQEGWPLPAWLHVSPGDVGMDPTSLERARDYALTGGGSGIITRRGKLVMSWGDPRQRYDLKSTTKSFGVTALGLAIADGRMALGDKALQFHPTLAVPPEANQNTGWIQQITLQHLATQTAGFAKPGGYTELLFMPGTQWAYSDSGPNWLAECITLLYQRDVSELMFARVFEPLGISAADLTWRRNNYREAKIDGLMRREFGSGIHANVDAMARLGYLYLREGRWNGRQIIPQSFVRAARTTVPSVVGLPERDPDGYGNASDHYGLLWWNNADGTLDTVPRDAYWSWGLHESLILVIPSLDLVVARAGKSWKRQWDGHYDVLKPFFEPIVAAVQREDEGVTSPRKGVAKSDSPEHSPDNPGAAVFHVNPAGHDEMPTGPFLSIERALESSRAVSGSKTIVVAAGLYALNRPLVLTGRDTGLTLKAAQPGQVRLKGGRKLDRWHRDGDVFYAADVPGVSQGDWDFRTLIVNGRYCPRARLPEEGTFAHLSQFKVPWMSTTGGGWKRKPTPEELTTLAFQPADMDSSFEVRNAEVRVYHMWDDSLVGVRSLDREKNTLTFSSPCGHPPGAFGVQKYVVYNTRAGMTVPGQWYLDRKQEKVVYWPLPGEDMGTADVWAPVVESLIVLQGDAQEPVENVTIQGFQLAVTTTPLQAGGFGAGRFAGAIDIRGARDCRLLDLEITHVGGQGIKVAGGGVRIERCHVHHVGACGIKAGGCTVHDNLIHHIGLTYPSAIGLVGGARTVLTHNTVHDTPYTAINCGGADCLIEANHIYRAMQVLHDGGGIYCFAGRNTVLRGNHIHDIVNTGGYGSSAYYLDERSEHCVVEGNLSYGVARPSHNHMAHNNAIRDNVFIFDGDARLTFPKSRDFTLERNVIVATGSIRFENSDAVTLKGNILFSETGTIVGIGSKNDQNTGQPVLAPGPINVFADPQIVVSRDGRVHFALTSPAVDLGIRDLDVSQAGCLSLTER